ncbi:hypothetical protein B0H21DRAFT_711606 [Amylocystis lapponica]|nr:hypothetical protein B0H21DRAFT_711606 [Amylocystis lapponica]
MLEDAMILGTTLTIWHDLSHLKALGKPEDTLPPDMRTHAQLSHPLVFEALAALVLVTVGAVLRTPALREVTCRSEMRHRAVAEQDAWLSFAPFVGTLAVVGESRKGQ